MKKVINILFKYKIFINIELCCSICHFRNLHQGHKLFEIKDEDKLKEEDIDMQEYIKEYDEFIQKSIDLRNLIEKEINKINKLYDSIFAEVTKSFEKKHEKLIKEENDMKQKLEKEVTLVKEKLVNNLSESTNIIKTN